MLLRRSAALLLSCSLLLSTTSAQVQAAVIGTHEATLRDAHEGRIASTHARLARDDVRQAMIRLGVDPVQASVRVASLSDAELAQVNERLESLPAGGGALGLIGAVFIELLILEIVGAIDVFKRI